MYYNKFPIKAKEDLLYYLRLSYEHLGLNLNEFPTELYGFIEEKSPMYSTAYGYIRNFEIDRIFSRPFGSNRSSQRVLEKTGFVLEARLEKIIYKNNRYEDELIYAIRKR